MHSARRHDARKTIAWLTIAAFFLLPFGKSAEAPALVSCAIGFWLLWAERATRQDALLPMVFCCYWLPASLSAIDAAAPAKSYASALAMLRFLPMAIAIVYALQDEAARAWAERAIGWIALAWAIDGIVQGVFGRSLGGVLTADRVAGVFGNDNLKLGPVLALLSPFAIVAAEFKFKRAGWISAWLVLAIAIMMAGSRAAWVCYALVTLMMLLRRAPNLKSFAKQAAAFAVFGLAAASAYYYLSPRFAERIDRTAMIAQGTNVQIDHALAGRWSIWRTATTMALAHPINGIGVRGFRYAYAQYASPQDPWTAAPAAPLPFHPHQIVLEIAAETGLVGLAFWALGCGLLWRRWRTAQFRDWPPASIALIAACFPINTHYAFYSSYWGLLMWLLIALACAPQHNRAHE